MWIRGVRRGIWTCRAVVLPSYGGPEVLELRTQETVRKLEQTEVLVRVHVAGVNPLDLRMREGYGRSVFQAMLPLVLGRDMSGVVAATGNGVQQLQVGDQVFGALHPTAERGTYSDYAIAAQEQLVAKPSCLSHQEAAALPFAALTAWRALHSTAGMVDGQQLLVLGGGGAVGIAAVQLAAAAGCIVAASCGKSSIDRVLAAGASQAVDHAHTDFSRHLRGCGKFDLVLDTIGVAETEAAGVGLLRKGGKYMTLQGGLVSMVDQFGLVAGAAAAMAKLLQKQVQYKQSHGVEYYWIVMQTDAEALEEIARLAEAGKMKIPVGQTLPLAEAAEAHRVLEGKRVRGKVVLDAEVG